jgi:glycosyltransferase involved in cell wall biosynthesis
MRVAVLWTRLSGYLNACLRELATRPGVQLLVVHERVRADAPYDEDQFAWIPRRLEYVAHPDRHAVLDLIRRFEPDVVLVSSWHIREFRHVLRRLMPRPVRVLCMDNQWLGTLKQRIGVLVSRWHLFRYYDAVFLPGERQACFARRLGFSDGRIWQGLYCPDAELISVNAPGDALHESRAFGYLGRLSPEKGIRDLLDAYQLYLKGTPRPWKLVVAGAGSMSPEVDRQQSVTRLGFMQPADLGAWMKTIACLVVPSRFEPWGVVVSEAATAGLPIVATEACGAVPHLVHDYANGRVARTGDARSLAECLTYIAGRSGDELLQMGRVSRGLASPYTPVRWTDTVLSRSAELMGDRTS